MRVGARLCATNILNNYFNVKKKHFIYLVAVFMPRKVSFFTIIWHNLNSIIYIVEKKLSTISPYR